MCTRLYRPFYIRIRAKFSTLTSSLIDHKCCDDCSVRECGRVHGTLAEKILFDNKTHTNTGTGDLVVVAVAVVRTTKTEISTAYLYASGKLYNTKFSIYLNSYIKFGKR